MTEWAGHGPDSLSMTPHEAVKVIRKNAKWLLDATPRDPRTGAALEHHSAAYERLDAALDSLVEEVERLTEEANKSWESLRESDALVARLEAALREVADRADRVIADIARAALSGETPARS